MSIVDGHIYSHSNAASKAIALLFHRRYVYLLYTVNNSTRTQPDGFTAFSDYEDGPKQIEHGQREREREREGECREIVNTQNGRAKKAEHSKAMMVTL